MHRPAAFGAGSRCSAVSRSPVMVMSPDCSASATVRSANTSDRRVVVVVVMVVSASSTSARLARSCPFLIVSRKWSSSSRRWTTASWGVASVTVNLPVRARIRASTPRSGLVVSLRGGLLAPSAQRHQHGLELTTVHAGPATRLLRRRGGRHHRGTTQRRAPSHRGTVTRRRSVGIRDRPDGVLHPMTDPVIRDLATEGSQDTVTPANVLVPANVLRPNRPLV